MRSLPKEQVVGVADRYGVLVNLVRYNRHDDLHGVFRAARDLLRNSPLPRVPDAGKDYDFLIGVRFPIFDQAPRHALVPDHLRLAEMDETLVRFLLMDRVSASDELHIGRIDIAAYARRKLF